MYRLKFKQIFIFLLIFLFSLFFSNYVNASPTLLENSTWQQNLTNVKWSSTIFGDIDNDADQDLLITGYDNNGNAITKIYENNGTSLVENRSWQQNLTGVYYSSTAFGDIDNDGDLDLAVVGYDGSSGTTKVYTNNGTAFVENRSWQQNLTTTNVYEGSVAFGDIDNDGDLDLAIISADSSNENGIYLNNGSSFVKNFKWLTNLPYVGQGCAQSSLVLGDIDNDGDLDLFYLGEYCGGFERGVYINNGTSLVEDSTWEQNIHAYYGGVSITLGDFDNDGDLDLIFSGSGSDGDVTAVYNNNGTTFVRNTSLEVNLIDTYEGSQGFGDYDNDGDLDFVSIGREIPSSTRIYSYSPSGFQNDPVAHENISNSLADGALAWADVNNDSGLDLIITGLEHLGPLIAKIYTNNISTTTPNTKPTPSIQFTNYTTTAGSIHLGWGNGSDAETPSNGLYYNIRLGSTSGSNDIISGKYGGGEDNGYFGNMMQRKNFTLKSTRLQTNTQYFWSVQVIDTALKQSSWSAEKDFTTIGDLTPPTVTLNAPVDDYKRSSFSITFNATGYDNINLTNMTLWGNWTGTWEANYTNSSGLNDTDYIFNLNLGQEGDGYYVWAVKACDNSSLCSWSGNRTFLVDTHYPNVSLMSPANDSTLTSSSVTFNYNVTDKAISNCSLIIEGVVDQTDYTVAVNEEQTFTKTLSDGNYRWSVNCTDTTNHTNSSKTWDFSIETPSVGAPSRGGVRERWVPECSRDRDCEGNERCVDNKCVRLFDIKIFGIDLPAIAGTFLKFSYLIKDMSGVNDDVRINFWLEKNNKRVADGSEVVYLGAGEEKTKKSKLYLSPFLYGNYKFYVEILYNDISVISHQLIHVERIKLEELKESFIKSLKESSILRQITGIIIILFVLVIIHFYIKYVLKGK